MEILRARFSNATMEVAELNVEIKRREAFTSTELLSDRLHRLLHFGTDCDYAYSDWPNPSGCRTGFHQLALVAENWFETVADPKRVEDFPLGQLIRFLEVARFGING